MSKRLRTKIKKELVKTGGILLFLLALIIFPYTNVLADNDKTSWKTLEFMSSIRQSPQTEVLMTVELFLIHQKNMIRLLINGH